MDVLLAPLLLVVNVICMTEFPFYSLNLLFWFLVLPYYFLTSVLSICSIFLGEVIDLFKTQSFLRGIVSPPVISNDHSILLSCGPWYVRIFGMFVWVNLYKFYRTIKSMVGIICILFHFKDWYLLLEATAVWCRH